MIHRDLIFDVGMHKGQDTAYYLDKGYRVVGFEADPDLASDCRERFDDALRTGRLRIVEGAIAPETESGTIAFYRNTRNSVWGTINEEFVAVNDSLGRHSYRIDVARIDMEEAFRVHGTPHYLKIDIEGADRLVLDALRSLPERPPYLSIEAEDLQFSRLEEELTTLRELGYRRFAAVQQELVARAKVVTRTLAGETLEFQFEEGASGVFGEDVEGWMGFEECLRRYRAIFRVYPWFGRGSPMVRYRVGRLIRRIARRWIVRGPFPGWYDTHAALE